MSTTQVPTYNEVLAYFKPKFPDARIVRVDKDLNALPHVTTNKILYVSLTSLRKAFPGRAISDDFTLVRPPSAPVVSTARTPTRPKSNLRRTKSVSDVRKANPSPGSIASRFVESDIQRMQSQAGKDPGFVNDLAANAIDMLNVVAKSAKGRAPVLPRTVPPSVWMWLAANAIALPERDGSNVPFVYFFDIFGELVAGRHGSQPPAKYVAKRLAEAAKRYKDFGLGDSLFHYLTRRGETEVSGVDAYLAKFSGGAVTTPASKKAAAKTPPPAADDDAQRLDPGSDDPVVEECKKQQ